MYAARLLDRENRVSSRPAVAPFPWEWQISGMDRRVASGIGMFALCATGCATTGLAWVHERESGVDLTPPEAPSETAPATRVSPPLVEEPVANRAPARPRLDRTITLGGTTESSARRYEAPVASGDPRTTIVNVYVNQMPPTAYGATYGYGYASPVLIAPPTMSVRTQAPAALRPGLDWPAVPNYGPAFPYRTGPASPWSGADPRRR
jgi:hypothetical protein